MSDENKNQQDSDIDVGNIKKSNAVAIGPGATAIYGVPIEEIEHLPPEAGDPPYRDLHYYDEEDTDWFFGRERVVATLVSRLHETDFLAVVGDSGSGKSSVVRAGIVPAMKRDKPLVDGSVPPLGEWQATVMTPTSRPLEKLLDTLFPNDRHLQATVYTSLKSDANTIRNSLGKQLTAGNPLLIVIDQFEEIFSQCKDEAQREAFIANVVRAAQSTCKIIITLRADFYAPCLRYEPLRQILKERQEPLGPMSQDELRAAILGPAAKGNWKFQKGLVEEILEDVGQEPGALPLLSHALWETWDKRRGRILTLSGYRATGGVKGAIAQTAENIYQDLSKDEQKIARSIFLRLTELGEGTQDTRRRAALSELVPQNDSRSSVEDVLKQLTDVRLLTTSEDGVEVAHEALIREWPTLQIWLDEDRDGLRLYHQLIEAAKIWQTNDQDASYLYRGGRLQQVWDWPAASTIKLNEQEQAFVRASIKDEAKQVRQRQIFRLGLFGVLIFIIAILLVAIRLIQNQATETERQRQIALAQSVAALSGTVMEQGNDTELATLLAIEGARLNWQNDGNGDWLIDNALRSYLSTQIYFNNTLLGHEASVLSVAFSPDGRTLASGSDDQTIRLWDISDPTAEPTVLRGHEASVLSVAFSPDGGTLASGSADQTIRLWDLSDPAAEPTVLQGHELSVGPLAFSPDGRTLASGSDDQTIRLWDISDPTAEPTVLRGHELSVGSVAFSLDGRTLASGSDDQTIRLWDLSDLEAEPMVLRGHEGWVRSVAFSPDGRTLASGSADQTVRLWDISDTMAEPTVLRGHEGWIWLVAFSPDGRALASGSEDQTIRLWDMGEDSEDAMAEPTVLRGHAFSVRSVVFSPDGRTLASGSFQEIRLWDMSDPVVQPTMLRGHEGWVRSVAFSPDGRTLASGSADQTIQLWDMSDPAAEPTVLWRHEFSVWSVAFSPDGRTLASGSDDQTIRLWDMSDPAAEPIVLRGHEGWVLSVAFSPDGRTLASGSDDQTIRLWDLSDPMAEPTVLRGHELRVRSVAFSPDGRTLASGSDDQTIRLWDLSDPTVEPTVLRGYRELVLSVVFAPDGRTLASGSFQEIRLWNMRDPAAEPTVLRGHKASVVSVAFSPDGRTLASGSDDQTIRLWDMRDLAAEPTVLRGHEDWVWSVAFSPDGSKLASGSADGVVRLWGFLEQLVNIGCQKVRRNLSWDEWQRYLPGEPYRQTCPNLPPALLTTATPLSPTMTPIPPTLPATAVGYPFPLTSTPIPLPYPIMTNTPNPSTPYP